MKYNFKICDYLTGYRLYLSNTYVENIEDFPPDILLGYINSNYLNKQENPVFFRVGLSGIKESALMTDYSLSASEFLDYATIDLFQWQDTPSTLEPYILKCSCRPAENGWVIPFLLFKVDVNTRYGTKDVKDKTMCGSFLKEGEILLQFKKPDVKSWPDLSEKLYLEQAAYELDIWDILKYKVLTVSLSDSGGPFVPLPDDFRWSNISTIASYALRDDENKKMVWALSITKQKALL